MESGDRIDRLTTVVESLSSEVVKVARLEAVVESLAGDISKVNSSIERLGESVTKGSKTDLSMLASWAGVIVVLIGMAGSGYVRDLEKNEARVTTNSQVLVDYLREDTSKVTEQAVIHNKDAITNLDTVLQREMRLLDAEASAQLGALDSRLQTEMRLLKGASDVQLDNLKVAAHRTLDWQNDHDKTVVGLNAAQWEQIKSNRKDIERLMSINKERK